MKTYKSDTSKNEISRRDFIAKGALVTTAMLFSSHAFASLALNKNDGATAPATVTGRRKLGALEVSSLGLGCMSMAGIYNAPKPKAEMVSLIRSAVESGVTFFDT